MQKKVLTKISLFVVMLLSFIVFSICMVGNSKADQVNADATSTSITDITYASASLTNHTYYEFMFTTSGASNAWHSDITGYLNDQLSSSFATKNGNVDILNYIYVNGVSVRELSNRNANGVTSYKSSETGTTESFPLTAGGCYAPVSVELVAATWEDPVRYYLGMRILEDFAPNLTFTITFKAGFAFKNADGNMVTLSTDKLFAFREGQFSARTQNDISNTLTIEYWGEAQSDGYTYLRVKGLKNPTYNNGWNTIDFANARWFNGSTDPLENIIINNGTQSLTAREIYALDSTYINVFNHNDTDEGVTGFAIKLKKSYLDAPNFTITLKAGLRFYTNEYSELDILYKDITYGFRDDGGFNLGYTLSFSGAESDVNSVIAINGRTLGSTLPAVPAKAGYTGVWTIDGANVSSLSKYNYGADKTAVAKYVENVSITDVGCVLSESATDCSTITFSFTSTGSLTPYVNSDDEKIKVNGYWNDHLKWGTNESYEIAVLNNGIDIMDYLYINGTSARALTTANEAGTTSFKSSGSTFPLTMGGCYAPVSFELLGDGQVCLRILDSYASKKSFNITLKAGFAFLNDVGKMIKLDSDITFKFGNDNVFGRVSTLSFTGLADTLEVVNGNKYGTLPTITATSGKVGYWMVNNNPISANSICTFTANSTATSKEFTKVNLANSLTPCVFAIENDEGTRFQFRNEAFDPATNVKWYWNDHESSSAYNAGCDVMSCIKIGDSSARSLSNANASSASPVSGTNFPFSVGSAFCPVTVEVERTTENDKTFGFFNVFVMKDYATQAITFTKDLVVFGDDTVYTFDNDVVFKYGSDNVFGQEYTLSFTGTESSVDSIKVVSGNKISNLPAVPDKANYDGAWKIGETTITSETVYSYSENKTATADYKVKEYSITYNNVEGLTNSNPTSYTVETTTITLQSVTKAGYTFGGWFTTSTFEDESVITEIAQGSTGNKVLYAKFTATEYSITYNNVEGLTNSNPTSYTVEDETITLDSVFKNNYAFVGWYEDADFTTAITEIAQGSTGNKVLYAYFIEDTTEYNNIFVGKSLTISKDFTVNIYVRVSNAENRPQVNFYTGSTLLSFDTVGELYEGTTYIYKCKGLSAKNLNTQFKAQIFEKGNGNNLVAKNYIEYTIYDYLTYLSENNPSDELKTLIGDIIVYGQELEKVVDSKTTSDIEEIEGCTASTYVAPESVESIKKNNATKEHENDKFTSATVQYGTAINIFVSFTVESSANFYITVDGEDLDYTVVEDEENTFQVKIEDISATYFAHHYSIKLYVDEELIQTFTYSVNSYTTCVNEESGQQTLAQRLYCYGKSVNDYIDSLSK